MLSVIESILVPFRPTPFSRSGRKQVKQFGYNIMGVIGLLAVILSAFALFLIDPYTETVVWIDMFAVFVTMILLTGLFVKYVQK